MPVIHVYCQLRMALSNDKIFMFSLGMLDCQYLLKDQLLHASLPTSDLVIITARMTNISDEYQA